MGIKNQSINQQLIHKYYRHCKQCDELVNTPFKHLKKCEDCKEKNKAVFYIKRLTNLLTENLEVKV